MLFAQQKGTLRPTTIVTPISLGGTGQVTANAALNALLPSQTSNSGKYLTTNGTNSSWGTVAGGSSSLSSLTAATGSNSIGNALGTQTWTFNNNSSTDGMIFSSTSKTTGELFKVSLTGTTCTTCAALRTESSGANANSSSIATGINTVVTNTGTSSQNIGVDAIASGASTNYGGVFEGGQGGPTGTGAGILSLGDILLQQGNLLIDGSSSGRISIKTQATSGTYNFNLPTTAGTAGYAMLSGGGSTAPMTYANTWVEITRGSVSVASNCSINMSSYYNLYTSFRIRIINAHSSASADFLMLTSPDGTTYDVGASDYSWGFVAAPLTFDAADPAIKLMDLMSSTATSSTSGIMEFDQASVTTYFHGFRGLFNHNNNVPASLPISSSGTRLSTAAIKGVQFKTSTGTITMTYVVEGLL